MKHSCGYILGLVLLAGVLVQQSPRVTADSSKVGWEIDFSRFHQKFLDKFNSLGGEGVLGPPGAHPPNTQPWVYHTGPGGDGRAQDFRSNSGVNGQLITKSFVDGNAPVFYVKGDIWHKFGQLGGIPSFVGWPAGDEVAFHEREDGGFTFSEGVWQQFEGAILFRSGHGTHYVHGQIAAIYGANGGLSEFGAPIEDPRNGNREQHFERGCISVDANHANVKFTRTAGRGLWTRDPQAKMAEWTVACSTKWGQRWDLTPTRQFRTNEGYAIFDDPHSFPNNEARQGWHTLRIRAWNGNGYTNFQSGPYGFDNLAPTVSQTGGPIPGTAVRPPQQVSWQLHDPHAGPKGWKVGRNADPGVSESFTEVTQGSLLLTEGTQTLYLRTKDNIGNISAPITLGPFTVLPPAPTGLTITDASCDGVDLTWADTSTTESGFQVERHTADTGWQSIGTTSAGQVAFTDTTFPSNTALRYRVRAFNDRGASDYSSEAVLPVPVISGLRISQVGPTRVALNWTTDLPIASEAHYGLSKAYGKAAVDGTPTTDHRLTLTNLIPGRLYHLQVCAGTALSNDAIVVTAPLRNSLVSGLGIVREGGLLKVTTTVTNGATQDVSHLQLNGATLRVGSATTAAAGLPFPLGFLAAGESVEGSFTFAGSSGGPGLRALLLVRGTREGYGFGGSWYLPLP